MSVKTVKQGLKTSEFWLALASAILAVFNEQFNLDIPVETVLAFAGVVVTYIGSRTLVKIK